MAKSQISTKILLALNLTFTHFPLNSRSKAFYSSTEKKLGSAKKDGFSPHGTLEQARLIYLGERINCKLITIT